MTTISILLLAALAADAASTTEPLPAKPGITLGIAAADLPPVYTRTAVKPLASGAERTSVQVEIKGQTLTLELKPYALRSADFELWVQDASGELKRVENLSPPKTYRGVVREWERTLVAASYADGRLAAMIHTAEHGDWYVQPLADAGRGAAADHAVYLATDVPPSGFHCGVTPAEEAEARLRRAARLDGEGGADGIVLRGGPTEAEVSIDADVEYFVASGSVEATVDDIEGLFVGIDAIYRNQVSIRYILNRFIVRTAEPDPYSSADSSTLLAQVRDHWQASHGGQERDIVHMFTGRNLSGTVVGRAYTGQVCDYSGPGAYGISQSRFTTNMAQRIGMTAHELGHSWDAEHCSDEAPCGGSGWAFDADCGIMCACIGGCNGSLTSFGSAARAEIIAHRNSRTCLGSFDATVYVDDSNNTGSEDGSPGSPYNTLREGLWACESGGTIMLFGGSYDWERTAEILNRTVTIRAQPSTGTPVIGQ